MTELQTQLSLEKARVRDLLRYYTPNKKQGGQKHRALLSLVCDEDETPVPPIVAAAEVVEGEDKSDLQICDNPSAAPHSKDSADAEEEIPDDSELLAHDPTLMAFTQLGAFRLNCERSFISLMDGKHQYIIAEATRTVSLNDPNEYDKSNPGEKVYLGARVLDMHWGVCPNTIQVFTALDDSLNLSTDLVTANKTCYVMNDLSAIPAYTDRPYVAGWPYMRFYAEVPIHSPTGYVIGTYCVVDNKPRDGLDKKGLEALNEIASAIMNHLALVRMQHGLQRADEMVKGLGLFVEGKSRPQEWMNPTNDANKRPPAHRMGTVHTLSTTTAQQRFVQEPTPASTVANSETDHKSVTGKSVTSSQKKSSSSEGSGRLRPRERKLSLDDISGSYESVSATGTKMLFSRASELIRDAIDLDGVVFVDACFRDIAVDPNPQVSRSDAQRYKGLPETPDYDPDEWLAESALAVTEGTPSISETMSTSSEIRSAHRRAGLSDVLGYSLSEHAILGGIASSYRQVTLPQSTLRALLKQYRHGHIFVFDEDGSLAQNAEELRRRRSQKGLCPDADTPDPERMKEQAWATQLAKICVGARSVIFFPLWDPQRDQWFSGGLAWTSDPTQILLSEDITYLTAFGSCIMAEKSRLDALTADRAKADFISSVSHELRSPLHGVLASAEALQETSTGFAQDDMIRTITVCGEVLLDTMDQILDYAKMSNSTHPKPSKNGKEAAKRIENQAMKDTSLDLSNLVESVVEGIFAGHSYRRGALLPTDGHKAPARQDSSTFSTSSGDIMVILSIDWQASWIFESQLGGWKRILMNLFGNALKYTEAGFVHISLRAHPTPNLDKNSTLTQTTVTLQIDDSGRGMSKDYMKYELYTPFAQEDHMSVGTGLGLSIVRQLVTGLGGTIDIKSEKGYGTSVKVAVAISPSENPEPQLLENMSMMADIKTRCQGLTLCLIGFEYYPDIGDTPTGILTAHAQRMLALKASTSTFAMDWFGMTVTTASSLHSANGDILIGLQSKLDFSGEGWSSRPLIVFEDVAPTRHQDEKGIFSLPQPVGPHKLARILGQCLEYIESIRKQKALDDIPITAQTLTQNLALSQNNSQNVGAVSPSDLMAIVEEINQKAMQAMRLMTTTSHIAQEPSHTPPLPALKKKPSMSGSKSPKSQDSKASSVTINQITHKINEIRTSSPDTPRRSRVLLVEDNIINMKILMNYMKNAKHQFATAANGLEALELYQADPQSFKVVFMDISMPVMDGLTSTRQMRLHERENSLPRTRIVALTCFSSAEYQRDALLSGIDLFLIKPVPMKTLRPILELDPDVVVPNPV